MSNRPLVTLPSVEAEKPGYVEITYIPGDGDPLVCKWRGIEFRANVPVRLVEKERPGMLQAARGNRFFRVGSESANNVPLGPPKTAMEYRAHVVEWIKGVQNVDQLVTRWADDRQTRERCEVGEDDIAYLGTLVEPKLRSLRLQEGLSEMDVAGIWVRHGVLDLPWRS